MPRSPKAIAEDALAFSRSFHEGVFADEHFGLPVQHIRQVMRRFATEQSALAVYLRSLVDSELSGDPLTEAWRRALEVLIRIHPKRTIDLRRHHSEAAMLTKRRAAMRKAVEDPKMAHALRAAVVADPGASWTFVEAVAVDGSREAVDALLPIFDRASKAGDTRLLEQFARLRQVARMTAPMKALFAATTRTRKQRRAEAQ